MKKYLMFLFMIVGFLLASCNNKFIPITSLEEFYAMESDKSYVLECDLDLEGREWVPLSVKNFNGNNHTIKNLMIYDYAAIERYNTNCIGLFATVNNIYNLNVENIFINTNCDSDIYCGFVAGKIYESAENIYIKNMQLKLKSINNVSNYVGGLAGEVRGIVKNIIANDSKITVNSEAKFDFIGGILGQNSTDGEMTNIEINNFDITCNIKSQYTNIGGICGEGYSSMSDIKSSKINLNIDNENTYSEIYVGGVGGEINSVDIKNVVSNSNNIYMTSSAEKACIGGIFGRSTSNIKNVLSTDNNIGIRHIKNLLDNEYYYTGGLIGYQEKSVYLNNQNISFAVAQNNNLDLATGMQDVDYIYNGGFVGYTTTSIYHSLINSNILSGSSVDIFANELNLIYECYCYNGEIYYVPGHNVNNIEIVNESKWSTILNNLGFDSNIWFMDNNVITLNW